MRIDCCWCWCCSARGYSRWNQRGNSRSNDAPISSVASTHTVAVVIRSISYSLFYVRLIWCWGLRGKSTLMLPLQHVWCFEESFNMYFYFFAERENTISRGRQTDNPQIKKKVFTSKNILYNILQQNTLCPAKWNTIWWGKLRYTQPDKI